MSDVEVEFTQEGYLRLDAGVTGAVLPQRRTRRRAQRCRAVADAVGRPDGGGLLLKHREHAGRPIGARLGIAADSCPSRPPRRCVGRANGRAPRRCRRGPERDRSMTDADRHHPREAIEIETYVELERGQWIVSIVVVFADEVVRERINTYHTERMATLAASWIKRAAAADAATRSTDQRRPSRHRTEGPSRMNESAIATQTDLLPRPQPVGVFPMPAGLPADRRRSRPRRSPSTPGRRQAPRGRSRTRCAGTSTPSTVISPRRQRCWSATTS